MRKAYALALCLLILAPVALAQDTAPVPAGVVNVNEATPEQLQFLPRIGPLLAARIIEWRGYDGWDGPGNLDSVPGIGPAIRSLLEPYVTFVGPTTLTVKAKAPKRTKPVQSENAK